MSANEKTKTIELIQNINSGRGDRLCFKELERLTGNPDVWVIFDELCLEGMSPEKIFDMFFAEAV